MRADMQDDTQADASARCEETLATLVDAAQLYHQLNEMRPRQLRRIERAAGAP